MISYGNLQGKDGKELQNYEMCACCLGAGMLRKSDMHNGNSFMQQIFIKLLQCAGMVLGTRDAVVGETKAVPALDIPVPLEDMNVKGWCVLSYQGHMLKGACDGTLRTPGSETTFQDPKGLNPGIHYLFILLTNSAQVLLLLIG